MVTNEKIYEIQVLYEDLKKKRSSWLSYWQLLAENFDARGFKDAEKQSEAEEILVNKKLLNTSPVIAARTLAAGMQGGMTSPARNWFNLRVPKTHNSFQTIIENGKLQQDDMQKEQRDHEVLTYIDQVSERMRIIFQNSNFYNVMFQAYQQLGVFGSACVLEEANLDGFYFTCMPVGSYVFDVNAKGHVDTLIRKIWLDSRQLIVEFGEDVLPESLRSEKSLKNKQKFEVYHAILPNMHCTKKYLSLYYMNRKDTDGNFILLRESYFDSQPFFGVRWDVQAGDIYGKSPAMDVLGSAMLLQAVEMDTAEGIHKQINPPVNAPAELQAIGVDLSAGAVNFVSNNLGTHLGVAPTLQVQPDVNAALLYIQKIENEIQTGMYNDLFRMLIGSDRRQITATEIASKEQEKLILIGPVLERLQDELFNPLIKRTFELMEKYNALPELPKTLESQSLKVEFVSTLAQAQKIVSTSSIEQLLAFTASFAQMKPEVLDALNSDVLLQKYADYLGTDASLLLSQEKINRIREERKIRENDVLAKDAVNNLAQVANTLSKTSLNEGNALDMLLGGLGKL